MIDLFYKSKNRVGECIFCFPLKEMVLWEGNHVRLVADTFPIRKGHVLISSKKHFGCFADLDIQAQLEVEQLLKSIKYPKFIAYEHGRAGSCGVEMKNCEHFHINVIPITEQENIKVEDKFTAVSSFPELTARYYAYGEYLLLIAGDEMKVFHTLGQEIPSHYLRTKVCEQIGSSAFADWSSFDHPDLFEMSIRFAKEVLS